jgi:predicted small metal-binding protein
MNDVQHQIKRIECDCGFIWKGDERQSDREVMEIFEQHKTEKHPFTKWKVTKFTTKN